MLANPFMQNNFHEHIVFQSSSVYTFFVITNASNFPGNKYGVAAPFKSEMPYGSTAENYNYVILS